MSILSTHPLSSNMNTDPHANAELLYTLLREWRQSAAWLLMLSLEKSTRADVLFNMGLTHHYAGVAPAKTLDLFDRALNALKTAAGNRPVMPRGDDYRGTRAHDIGGASFLNPMTLSYVAAFPDIAGGDMLLAGAHVAHAAGLMARRDGYLAGLQGPEYDNFKNELNKG